jgi:hypothetical protein
MGGGFSFGRGRQSPGVEILGDAWTGLYVDESGFWKKITRAASEIARRAGPLAKYAAPLLLPAAAIPIALLTVSALKKRKRAAAITAAPIEEAPAPESEDLLDADLSGHDEMEAARSAGGAERAYMQRLRMGELLGQTVVIPHSTYRSAILQRAKKLSGSEAPSTIDFARAQKSVRRDMSKNGLRIGIPGSRPARVTR